MAGLSVDRREALRKVMRQNLLGDGADGPFIAQGESVGGAWCRALKMRTGRRKGNILNFRPNLLLQTDAEYVRLSTTLGCLG